MRRSRNVANGYASKDVQTSAEKLGDLLPVMKKAAAALREAGIEFMLGGGLAAWARGGPPTEHDVDFYVREEDAERGLAALEEAGLRVERPPEDWLYKAYDGDVLVDLIFRPAGGPITDEHFERSTWLEVNAHRLLVASIDDVLLMKLLALTEQEPEYGSVLELARALREQIDWEYVRSGSSSSPFAEAFFTMLDGLDIVPQRDSLNA